MLATALIQDETGRNILGGGDVRFLALARRLEQRGVPLGIITTSAGLSASAGMEFTEGVQVVGWSQLRRFGLPFMYLVNGLLAVAKALRLQGPTCFYSTSDYLPDVLPAYIHKKRHPGSRWVQVIHHLMPLPKLRQGTSARNLLAYRAQQVSLKFIKKQADLVIVVNPLMKDQLVALGFEESKVEVNPNGVSLAAIDAGAPTRDRESYDAVHVGRLHPAKGVFDLVEVWGQVHETNRSATLALVGIGDAKTRAELEQEIASRGLGDNVKLLGYLPEAEVFGLLKASRVFVSASYEEGFGLAICEAMACGTPVIAWNLPVYDALYDGGMVKIPVGDLARFAASTVEILRDGKLRDRLAREAAVVGKRYDWESVAEREHSLLIGLRD